MDSPNLPFARGSLPAGYLNMSVEDLGHYLIAQLNHLGEIVLSVPLYVLLKPVNKTLSFFQIGTISLRRSIP